VNIGSGGLHRVDQASVLVDADVDFHAEIPLVALLGLVHLGIPLALLVLGGAGSRDQGGIDDRSLLHGHAIGLEVGLHRLKDLLTQIVLLEQVPERQDRGFIRDPLADQVDPCKSSHPRHLNQRILHRGITEVIPLLHQMDSEHCLQRIGRATALGAGPGVVGLDQIDQRLPGHNLLHPSQKLLTPGALLGCGLLIVSEPELLAVHEPRPYLGSQGHCPVSGVAFPESP